MCSLMRVECFKLSRSPAFASAVSTGEGRSRFGRGQVQDVGCRAEEMSVQCCILVQVVQHLKIFTCFDIDPICSTIVLLNLCTGKNGTSEISHQVVASKSGRT